MMQPGKPARVIYRVCWTLVSVTFFILVNGYYVNNGDQEEHLPYVYKLLNPDLYRGDYLVPFQTSEFTVRFYFAHLIAFFGKYVPVVDVVLFFYVICIAIFSYITGVLAEKLTREESTFVLSQFIALTVFNGWTTGGNTVMDIQLTCTVFAATLGALAIYSGFRHRHRQMALFAGLAALFQVLVGLQVFLFLLVVMVGYDRTVFRFKNLVITGGIFLLAASPMLFPVLYRQFFMPQVYDHALYKFVLFHFRNSHHYVPEAFPLKDYIKTCIVWLGATLIMALGFYKEFRRFYTWLSLVIIVGAVFYYLCFSIAGSESIGKLQWFKTTVWLTWTGAIVIAARMTSFKLVQRLWQKLRGAGIVVPLMLLAGGILFMSLGGGMNKKLAMRYNFFGKAITDYQRMHAWIKRTTPLDCIILIPPGDDSYLCEAQRPTPVAWKGIIHEPWFLLPWYEQYRIVYGNDPDPAKSAFYYRRNPDSSIHLKIRPDFRMVDVSVRGPQIPDSLIVHREGSIVLLRFSEEGH